MDFVNYCIETKNYSALKAIRDYSEEVRTFSKPLSKKQKIVLAATVPATAVLTEVAANNMDKLGKAKKAVTDFIDGKTEPLKKKLQELDDKYGREFRKGSGEETLRDRYLDLKDKVKSIGKSSDEDTDSDDDADDSADDE